MLRVVAKQNDGYEVISVDVSDHYNMNCSHHEKLEDVFKAVEEIQADPRLSLISIRQSELLMIKDVEEQPTVTIHTVYQTLQKFQQYCDDDQALKKVICKCCDRLSELEEQQTPYKPIVVPSGLEDHPRYICPSCNRFVYQKCDEHFCGVCGQRLDWQEK